MPFIFEIEYQYEVSPGVFITVTQDVEIPSTNFTNLTEGPYFISKGQKLKVPLPEGAILYTVKPGDNVFALAKKYGVTEQAILDANNFTNDKLQDGQQIIIPAKTKRDMELVRNIESDLKVNHYNNLDNSGKDELNKYYSNDIQGSSFINTRDYDNSPYEVRNDDSLWNLARRWHTTVQEIRQVNNLESNILHIGQKIINPINEQRNTNNEEYIINFGDTLWSIAKNFETTVNELKKYNSLDSNTALIGSTLKIPVKRNEIIYTVQPGDSLWSIAKKYNTTEEALKKLNNVDPKNLQVGTKIKIPVTSDNSNKENTYIVQAGDSLWSIAKKFGTTEEELLKLNDVDPDNLQIGTKLIIPSKGSSGNDTSTGTTNFGTYIVRSGDTLASISKQFSTTPEALIKLNNLTPIIKIFEDFPVDIIGRLLIYRVDYEVTLRQLAKDFGIPFEYMQQSNPDINPDEKLKIGTKVKVPILT